jgi:hypothetical protein
MLDLLDRKIRQMHEALCALEKSDLLSIEPEQLSTHQGFYFQIDFSQGNTEAGLANIVSLLIANIACMKDHLKVWCTKNNKVFEGENLINSDKNVAIVHDLWNIEKHAELDRPPRSGHRPRIQDLSQMLSLSTGTSAGSSAMFTIDPRTGGRKTQTQGNGSVKLVITAQVVDEHGTLLGDFAEICEKATAAWEQTLNRAGVAIPDP